MNKSEKFRSLCEQGYLEGQTLFRPMLMHFAARFAGKTYAEFASDYRARVYANLRCLEHFDIDMVALISDPYAETAAFGAPIEYLPEAVPRCLKKIVVTADDVRDLKNPDVYRAERTLDRLRGAELYQKELGGSVPVIGWVEGPLAEACDLVGVSEMFTMLMMDPDFSNALLDKVMVTAKEFARAQIEAGCDIIGIGDAVCSQIDPHTYDLYVKERHRELVAHIHDLGAKVKFHVCGDVSHLLPAFAGLNLDLIDLDSPVDLGVARNALGPDVILTGNLDPVMILDSDAEVVYERARSLVHDQRGTRYILAGGCEIAVNTPVDNLMAMRQASKDGQDI